MRFAWVLTAAITLSACGAASSSPGGAGNTLPDSSVGAGPIEVSADSELARMLGPDTPAEFFTAAAELEFPAGQASLREMSMAPPTENEVRLLADLVGVPGEIAAFDDEFGAGRVVGSPESVGGALLVRSFGEPFWSLQRSEEFLIETGAVPCPTLPVDDPNAGRCARGLEPSTTSPPDDSVVESTVAQLMSGIGVPADSYRTEKFTFGSNTEVRVEFSPDGLRSDVTWSVAISGSGQITSGSGPLRAPVIVDQVATVPLTEALIRLSRISPGVPVGTVPAPSTTALAAPTTINLDANPVLTAPPQTAPPAPVVLPTITGVEPGLVSVWDITNRLWLVPAIVVTGDFGFVTSIPVISADMVRIVDATLVEGPVRTGPPLTVPTPPATIGVLRPTVESPTPLPTTTGSITAPPVQEPQTTPVATESVTEPRPTLPVPPDPNTPPSDVPTFYSDELNKLLVGEPLEGAWTRLLDAGWKVRVDNLDDTTETFTADLRVDRVTLQFRDGIVTNLIVG